MTPEWHAVFAGRYTVTEVGCWEWTACRARSGYGRLRFAGSVWWAHRLSRFLAFGDLPEAACHRCDNPPCINPEHLRAGTRSDNTAEMWAKGRGTSRVRPEHVAILRAAAQGGRQGRRARVDAAASTCGFSVRTAYRVLAGSHPGHRLVRDQVAA